MRITTKLTIATMTVICLVLIMDAFLSVERELDLFEDDMVRDGIAVASTIASTVRANPLQDPEVAVKGLRDVDALGHHLSIRWIWADRLASEDLEASSLHRLEDGLPVGRIRSEGQPSGSAVAYAPVRAKGRLGAIEVVESLEDRDRYVRASIIRSAVVVFSVMAAAFMASVVTGRWLVGRPVEALVAKAREVGRGEWLEPVRIDRRDELGMLARELDLMSEQLAKSDAALSQSQLQLRHAERLATVGQLAAGIAHEVGTPLNVIIEYGKLIARDSRPGSSTSEGAEIIVDRGRRITGIIKGLLGFSRNEQPRMERVSVTTIVRRALHLCRAMARTQQVEIDASIDGDVLLLGNGPEIEQVVVNLVLNGIQAMEAGGRLDVTVDEVEGTHPWEHQEMKCVRLVVDDDGTGIDEADQERIFDPFFTKKAPEAGTGLGLSVVKSIVENHGGWIELDSTPGRGSRFEVYFPKRQV